MKLLEAFNQFLPSPKRRQVTQDKYRYKLRPFLEEHGAHEVEEITAEIVSKWFADLEKVYVEATISMVRDCLVSFFNHCVAAGWLEKNPANCLPHYDDRPKRVRTANEEHLNQALTFCGILSMSSEPQLRRDAAIFALGAISGARRSNLVMLPHRDTLAALERPFEDDRVGNIYTVTVAGKTSIEIVFGDWHATLLTRYLEVRPESRFDRLFVHLRKESPGRPLGPKGVGDARRRICHIAGVPVITFQEMRKLKGTQIARKFGLELAAEALGHVSGTRVIRDFYYDPDRSAARAAILATGTRY